MAAQRYEQNDDFFVRMFSDPDMMRQVMETVGSVLYERLRKGKISGYEISQPIITKAAEENEACRNNTADNINS